MDLSPTFNEALHRHNKPPIQPHAFDLDGVEAFMKEAYRINKHISELNQYLRSIRQSYLSAAQPPRRSQLARTNSSSSIPQHEKERKYLTDAQREQIDAETKQLLRELSGAIKNLADAENVRQSADETIALRKRATKGLGALGRWAAGGAITAKSPEEELEEAKQNTIKIHRDGVIWFLSRKLEEVSGFQASMMEIRLEREREKSKSVLYKARSVALPPMDDPSGYSGTKAAGLDEKTGQHVEQELSAEQLQLFAEENQDMLKHYEDTLDKVRTTERSLLEISELQSTLATNLFEQQAQIDQLVQDSHLTAENVGSGNKELKRATERRSIAQAIFYATCAMCGTLVVWDLII
ncbi:t-snare protein [Diplodia corticola]|uniref:T-snare protein n=1 Tax=Diplodia corticola TaxID=236234 RepID=A0A1J9S9X8_9PEZI|nr:t-snare protein [Diplodia corticola]OJD36389.1 t-snare protein [Diplodia corticola]